MTDDEIKILDDWKLACFWLWAILDDIDTLADMLKPEQNEYFDLVTKLHNRRRLVLHELDVDTLYDQYYPEQHGLFTSASLLAKDGE